MDCSLPSSVQKEPSYVSLLKESFNSKSLSDVTASGFNDCSEPSSSDDVSHSNAIKRIRSETGAVPDPPESINELSDSFNEATLEDQWTEFINEKTCTEPIRYSENYSDKESHFFILSQSGKPIFSRYGSENQTAAFIGVMQALVSFVESTGDVLKVMKAGKHSFVFLIKPRMILVGVSQSEFAAQQIKIVLNYLYNQILSLLTFRTINRIYEKQAGVDIRRLLIGTDRYLNGMIDYMEHNMSPLINAVTCVPMHYTLRQSVLTVIGQAIKVNDLVFAILLWNEKLVGVVRRKDQQSHSIDLHLLLNLIRNSSSFKIQTCWLPICLPKFDADGFFYAHISYLTNEVCLVLLTVNPEQFDVLQDCQSRIKTGLESGGLLNRIGSTYSVTELLQSQRIAGEVIHFVYKMRSAGQCIDYSNAEKFTNNSTYMQHIFDRYLRMNYLLHRPDRSARLIYEITNRETLISWFTNNFELYATLSPMTTKRKIMETVNKLLEGLNRQKNRLFVLISQTF